MATSTVNYCRGVHRIIDKATSANEDDCGCRCQCRDSTFPKNIREEADSDGVLNIELKGWYSILRPPAKEQERQGVDFGVGDEPATEWRGENERGQETHRQLCECSCCKQTLSSNEEIGQKSSSNKANVEERRGASICDCWCCASLPKFHSGQEKDKKRPTVVKISKSQNTLTIVTANKTMSVGTETNLSTPVSSSNAGEQRRLGTRSIATGPDDTRAIESCDCHKEALNRVAYYDTTFSHTTPELEPSSPSNRNPRRHQLWTNYFVEAPTKKQTLHVPTPSLDRLVGYDDSSLTELRVDERRPDLEVTIIRPQADGKSSTSQVIIAQKRRQGKDVYYAETPQPFDDYSFHNTLEGYELSPSQQYQNTILHSFNRERKEQEDKESRSFQEDPQLENANSQAKFFIFYPTQSEKEAHSKKQWLRLRHRPHLSKLHLRDSAFGPSKIDGQQVDRAELSDEKFSEISVESGYILYKRADGRVVNKGTVIEKPPKEHEQSAKTKIETTSELCQKTFGSPDRRRSDVVHSSISRGNLEKQQRQKEPARSRFVDDDDAKLDKGYEMPHVGEERSCVDKSVSTDDDGEWQEDGVTPKRSRDRAKPIDQMRSLTRDSYRNKSASPQRGGKFAEDRVRPPGDIRETRNANTLQGYLGNSPQDRIRSPTDDIQHTSDASTLLSSIAAHDHVAPQHIRDPNVRRFPQQESKVEAQGNRGRKESLYRDGIHAMKEEDAANTEQRSAKYWSNNADSKISRRAVDGTREDIGDNDYLKPCQVHARSPSLIRIYEKGDAPAAKTWNENFVPTTSQHCRCSEVEHVVYVDEAMTGYYDESNYKEESPSNIKEQLLSSCRLNRVRHNGNTSYHHTSSKSKLQVDDDRHRGGDSLGRCFAIIGEEDYCRCRHERPKNNLRERRMPSTYTKRRFTWPKVTLHRQGSGNLPMHRHSTRPVSDYYYSCCTFLDGLLWRTRLAHTLRASLQRNVRRRTCPAQTQCRRAIPIEKEADCGCKEVKLSKEHHEWKLTQISEEHMRGEQSATNAAQTAELVNSYYADDPSFEEDDNLEWHDYEEEIEEEQPKQQHVALYYCQSKEVNEMESPSCALYRREPMLAGDLAVIDLTATRSVTNLGSVQKKCVVSGINFKNCVTHRGRAKASRRVKFVYLLLSAMLVYLIIYYEMVE